jgi:1A family penicillin-binding protein
MSADIFYHKKRPKAHARKNRLWRTIKTVLKLTAFLFLLAVLFIGAIFAYYAKDLPDPQKISERQIVESTKIFDRTGKILLYDIHGEEQRTIVSLDQISKYLRDATIATEDANFYNHFGLDFKGIARAALGVLTGNKSAGGGSTITQQLIKKLFFTDARSYTRKVKEWILALEMERRYSKDEILNFYLNQIPYGSNTYGIEAATQTFFGKPAKDLTLAESATLAALPNAPSRLSPYGSHPEELKMRQEYILDRMSQLGYISAQEADGAKKEKLVFAPQTYGIKAPHFVMYIKEYLEDKYGADYVEKSGLKVYTTIDWDLQQMAEQIIYDGAKSNQQKYNAANAALTALDPKTGQILVMVGSYDYFATSSLPLGCDPGKNCLFEPNVNVTVRDRQPGSSFKPFAYVTAFEKGFTADTILFDLKTEFNQNCPPDSSQDKDRYGLECYHPNNYDERVRGPVTARQALAQSLNIPSVQMLYLAGIDETIKTAKSMGITSLNEPYYGLSLVLGGGEVTLLDEVAAYGVFAAEGVKNEKTAILKIEDNKGNVIEEFNGQPKKIFDPQYARMISDILSDNQTRSPVFGSSSPLYFAERPVAAKTGTTQKYRDAWTIGYTPSLVAGIWVGNNDGTSMAKSGAGISAAGPIWHAFLKKAYEMKNSLCEKPSFCLPNEPEQFTKPEPISTGKAMLDGLFTSPTKVRIDKISGQLATEQTPPELIEEKFYNQIHNILYYVNKDDPRGDSPADPAQDPQYNNWEFSTSVWLAQNSQYIQTVPTQSDTFHTNANLPRVKIISPYAGQTINQSSFFLQIEASAPLGVKQIDYFLNDDFIGSLLAPPYQATVLIPAGLSNASGSSAIVKIRAYDNVFNRQEDSVTIFINR